jgi:hypothetical protein
MGLTAQVKVDFLHFQKMLEIVTVQGLRIQIVVVCLPSMHKALGSIPSF